VRNVALAKALEPLEELPDLEYDHDEDDRGDRKELIRYGVVEQSDDASVEIALEAGIKGRSYVPQTYLQAVTCDAQDRWKKAMDDEIEKQTACGTWYLTVLPQDRKAVGCRWVYTLVLNRDGTVDKYKARLVAQRFSQRAGVDYHETWALTGG